MSAMEITIAKLLSASPITSLVDQRVYPGEAPQRVSKPYLIIDLAAETDSVLLQGPAAQFPESRVQISCVASSMAEANSLGEAVKEALQDTFKEAIAGHTDVDIRKAALDYSDRSDDRNSFQRLMDWYVRWRP